ncbi:MAG: hypothetical protein PHE89_06345 [Alphaproteobacteria bacterium]|nr:hypothetical protein [Alphaproteobacteria bacterium]
MKNFFNQILGEIGLENIFFVLFLLCMSILLSLFLLTLIDRDEYNAFLKRKTYGKKIKGTIWSFIALNTFVVSPLLFLILGFQFCEHVVGIPMAAVLYSGMLSLKFKIANRIADKTVKE